MLIECISDLHGEIVHPSEESELVLFAGDFLCHSSPGNYNMRKELSYINKILAPHIEKILKTKEVFMVWGNHDALMEFNPELLPQILREKSLINQSINYKGIHIYGTPYQPWFLGWNFNRPDTPDSLGQIYSLIPDGVDILLTHCPAYGILDVNRNGWHCGSRMLKERIDQVKPKYHIAGHIHESRGILQTEKTTFINCSVMNENYIVTNKSIVFDY